MAFGLQTFNEDGSVDFDSNSPLMRVIHKRRVTGSISFTISNYAPPYYVIVIMESPPVLRASEIRWTQSGNTINIQYVSFQSGGYWSIDYPALVMVCK